MAQRMIQRGLAEGVTLSELAELWEIPESELQDCMEGRKVTLSDIMPKLASFGRDHEVLKAVQKLSTLKVGDVRSRAKVSQPDTSKILLDHNLHPFRVDGAEKGPPNYTFLPPAMVVREGAAMEALNRNPEVFDAAFIGNRVQVLAAILEHDAISLEQIHQITGLPYEEIEEVVVFEDLVVEISRRPRDSEIDKLLFEEKLVAEEAGRRLGKTRAAIYQYLQAKGLMTLYKRTRREMDQEYRQRCEEFGPVRQQMVNLLVNRGLTMTDDPDEQDVIWLRARRLMKRYPYEQLLRVMQGHSNGLGGYVAGVEAQLDVPKNCLASRVHRIWNYVGRSAHHKWPTNVTPKEAAEMKRLEQEDGLTVEEIADLTGRCLTTVIKWTGGLKKSDRLVAEEIVEMKRLRHEEGLSATQISGRMGCTRTRVIRNIGED